MTQLFFFRRIAGTLFFSIILAGASIAGATEPPIIASSPPGLAPATSLSNAPRGTPPVSPATSAEPVSQAQVELLMDGVNLDKHYYRYLRHFERYENFLAYAYELNARLYNSGKHRISTGRVLLIASAPMFVWGGINVYRSARQEKKDEQDFEDGRESGWTDSSFLRATAGGLFFVGGGLALAGLIALTTGMDRKEKAARALKKMKPYVRYYAPVTAKRFQLSGIGIAPTRNGAIMGATVSF